MAHLSSQPTGEALLIHVGPWWGTSDSLPSSQQMAWSLSKNLTVYSKPQVEKPTPLNTVWDLVQPLRGVEVKKPCHVTLNSQEELFPWDRGADSISSPVGTDKPCVGCFISLESHVTSDMHRLQPPGSEPRCLGVKAQHTGQKWQGVESHGTRSWTYAPKTESVPKMQCEKHIVFSRG